MKLYIVQHGNAATKQENPLRPLTEQGIYDIQQLAEELDDRGITPGHIFHSGKERAAQTATIIADQLGRSSLVKQVDGITPNDAVDAFASYIKPFADDVLVVSHMPFVQNLCIELLGDNGLGSFEFEPGKIVCIDIEEYRPILEWTI